MDLTYYGVDTTDEADTLIELTCHDDGTREITAFVYLEKA